MINLRKIAHWNLVECLDLGITEEQEDFVDSNAESLAEAYASVTNGGFATPYAIYDGDVMVGFVMYTYYDKPDAYDLTDVLSSVENPADVPYKAPCYYIWRLLIDKNHQRKGYGKQAIEKIITEIKTMPHGQANCIYTSWHPDNIGSKTLFASLGFKETGEVEGSREDEDYEVVVKLEI